MPKLTPEVQRKTAWRRAIRRFAKAHPQHAAGVRFVGHDVTLTRRAAVAFFTWIDAQESCTLTPNASVAAAILTTPKGGNRIVAQDTGDCGDNEE